MRLTPEQERLAREAGFRNARVDWAPGVREKSRTHQLARERTRDEVRTVLAKRKQAEAPSSPSLIEMAIALSVTVGIGYVAGSYWRKRRQDAARARTGVHGAPAPASMYLHGIDVLCAA